VWGRPEAEQVRYGVKIPPRPSRSPAVAGAERQFRLKWVRAFSNKGRQIGLRDFWEAKAIVCSLRRKARRANLCFPHQKIEKVSSSALCLKMREPTLNETDGVLRAPN